MATILSSTVYTIKDVHGNPRTEAWITCVFGEAYQGPGGGIAFDLSPYFRTIHYAIAQPLSGAVLRAPVSGAAVGATSGYVWASGGQVSIMPVVTDFSTPTSTRFQIYGVAVPLVIAQPLSGVLPAGFGGMQELASGVAGAVSGIQFMAHILGQ